ncbi:hypothetical protein Pan44_49170 [Caulifigura coniformis]|uniref:Uncharacterized protein n=1 Tax=Caulifigura coniformis TaxID=2527983 RepID=A0A517SL59_9PLAN|nr:hypothetical protein [Caulifigura coniformis]QDT56857.1 hypothetical protein Pan44_49170 [Caulifigura coniformis]
MNEAKPATELQPSGARLRFSRRCLTLFALLAIAAGVISLRFRRTHPPEFVGQWGIRWVGPRLDQGFRLNPDGTGEHYVAWHHPGGLYYDGEIRWWVQGDQFVMEPAGLPFATQFHRMISDVYTSATTGYVARPLTRRATIEEVSVPPDRHLRLRYPTRPGEDRKSTLLIPIEIDSRLQAGGSKQAMLQNGGPYFSIPVSNGAW